MSREVRVRATQIDKRYFTKSGKVSKGNFYTVCGRFMLENKDAILVHGAHRNPDGLRIGHAWIELGDVILDLENNFFTRKEIWYADEVNTAFERYTQSQAQERMLETEHFGQWDARSDKVIEEARRIIGGS